MIRQSHPEEAEGKATLTLQLFYRYLLPNLGYVLLHRLDFAPVICLGNIYLGISIQKISSHYLPPNSFFHQPSPFYKTLTETQIRTDVVCFHSHLSPFHQNPSFHPWQSINHPHYPHAPPPTIASFRYTALRASGTCPISPWRERTTWTTNSTTGVSFPCLAPGHTASSILPARLTHTHSVHRPHMATALPAYTVTPTGRMLIATMARRSTLTRRHLINPVLQARAYLDLLPRRVSTIRVPLAPRSTINTVPLPAHRGARPAARVLSRRRGWLLPPASCLVLRRAHA